MKRRRSKSRAQPHWRGRRINMARSASVLYLAGATLVLATLALQRGHGTNVLGVAAIACGAYLAGIALWQAGAHVPDWGFQFLTALGTTFVTGAIYFGGHDYSGYALLYLWVSTYSFYFFDQRQALTQSAYIAVASSVVLLSPLTRRSSAPTELVLWIMVVGSVVVAGLFVQLLVESIRESARTDFLTRLPNRGTWDIALEDALRHQSSAQRPIAVAVLDLDHFKNFNDDYGHSRGDALLQELAKAWQNLIRGNDLIARYGGEEFAVLLYGCTKERALEVVDRLRSTTPLGSTASAGIAVWDEHQSPSALMARADGALYDAKRQGRNRTVLAR